MSWFTDLFHCASIPTWLETDMARTGTHQLPTTLLLNCHLVIKLCTLYCCFWFMGGSSPPKKNPHVCSSE